jgi:hypothetical protein
MAFVPQGQADSSQARSASAPKGLEDSAQGFNPGNRPERFALKGRQIERTNNAKVDSIVARLNCAF